MMELTQCSPGLNLSTNNFLCFKGCLTKNEFYVLRGISVHLELIYENLKIPMFDLFLIQNGSFAFSLQSLMEVTQCSPGLN